VTITSDDRENNSIIVHGGNGSAGIGEAYNKACGNIIIEKVTVKAYGSYSDQSLAPGIGGSTLKSFGNITIKNATVTAYADYSSGNFVHYAIGNSRTYTSSENEGSSTITIDNSEIYAYRGTNYGNEYIKSNNDPKITNSTIHKFTMTGKEEFTEDGSDTYDQNGAVIE